jgi:hypothetical protein
VPVVINEFEVVAEPARETAPAVGGGAAEHAAPHLDLDRLLAERRARAERVRTY